MPNKTKYGALAALLFWACTFIPAQALTYAEIANQGRVLGDSSYASGSLVNDSGTIYFITGNTKVPFTSWAAFVGLGYSARNVVKGSLANYTPSQSYTINTAGAQHPWGSWLSYKGTVYYSIQAGLIGVPSAAIFTSNGGQWGFVVPANKYDIAALQLNPNLPALTANDPRVSTAVTYQFSSGTPQTPSSPMATTPSVTPTPSPSPAAASSVGTTPGTLNTPTLAASSLPSQFVYGSTTNQPIATFNFTASGSPVTIQEMDFMAVGGSVVPVASVNVNGQIAYFNGASSTVAGLNITVPSGGVNVPVTVNYPVVSPNNVPANQVFTLNLAAVKYVSGGVTSYLYPNLPSKSMDLVSSSPSVSLISSTQALTDNNILIAKVKVSANVNNIVLNQLPLIISATGGAFVFATSSNVMVTDDNGGFPLPVSYGTFGLASGTPSTLNIVFNGDNSILGNSSKTYDVYIPIQGPLGNPGSSSVTTTLGLSNGFTYTDPIAGATGQNIPGGNGNINYILNYPTAGVSVHN